MSMVDILTVPVFGGKADAEKLWPEGIAMGEWSDVGEPARWEEIWKQRNKRPHVISGLRRELVKVFLSWCLLHRILGRIGS